VHVCDFDPPIHKQDAPPNKLGRHSRNKLSLRCKRYEDKSVAIYLTHKFNLPLFDDEGDPKIDKGTGKKLGRWQVIWLLLLN